MTLEQLKMLKAVIDAGSVQSASATLYKTQPAISKGIKQLESALGVPLMDRSGYKLKLTQQGEIIYQKALILLEQSDQLKQIADHLKTGHEAKVVIAVDAMFDLAKLIPVFERTQNEFPNTQIILKQEFISGAIESVLKDNAQLAISVSNDYFLNNFKLDGKFISTQRLINIASPKMIARHEDLKERAQLKDEYQIIVQDSGSLTKNAEMDVQQGQRKWYVHDFHSKRTLCLSGIGWGRLPHFLVAEDIERGLLVPLDLIDVKNEVTIKSVIMKRAGSLLGPVATALWDQIIELAEETSNNME